MAREKQLLSSEQADALMNFTKWFTIAAITGLAGYSFMNGPKPDKPFIAPAQNPTKYTPSEEKAPANAPAEGQQLINRAAAIKANPFKIDHNAILVSQRQPQKAIGNTP